MSKIGRLGSTTAAVASSSRDAADCRSSTQPQRKVVYFVDNSVTAIAYAEDHIMRPSRVRALHSLVKSLGLDKDMTICASPPASEEVMASFHRRAYLECLRQAPFICGNPMDPLALSFQKEFDVPVGSKTGDCPLFAEVWPLVASQAGASIACAEALLSGEASVAINWAGGMHHAAAAHASGFCFVNDIVLCIRRLLQRYQRVLYVDLDVHHGDGVEGAFLGNPRVLTLSIHQFGNQFFPGTGGLGGPSTAFDFTVNVPLPTRTGDEAYTLFFRSAFSAVVNCFDPEAIVVQCGADTITGDLIGRLCVTTATHTQCVSDVLSLGLPTVLLGGGGYHVFHTVKCWAIHTATAVGRPLTRLPVYVPRTDQYYLQHRRESAPRRPTLHVHLDPDLDVPMPMLESMRYWRRFCASLGFQMAATRRVRQGLDRIVVSALERRRLLLESEGRPTETRETNRKRARTDSLVEVGKDTPTRG